MRRMMAQPTRTTRYLQATLAAILLLLVGSTPARATAAEKPTVEFALQLAPIQRDIDFDKPTDEEAQKCVIESENQGNAASWVVKAEDGQTLRRFQDTNNDGKVDHWCYFKGGIEVYRDIDGNNNGKADQYRWLGTAGTRWGIDDNEDGRIDHWKVISAEEVTAEVVAALRENDAQRFTRLLIEKDELQSLGLGQARAAEIQREIEQAADDFATLADQQEIVTSASTWVFFGGGRPGVIPTGTDGSTADVYLYDNVSAVIETDGKNAQVPIGALVRVGESWRLIDVPASLTENDAIAGTFFQASLVRPPQAEDSPNLDEGVQALIADLDSVDKQLASADQKAAAELNAQRADLLEKLVAAAQTPEEKTVWIRQFADTVSAAVQTGAFPGGIARLETLLKTLTDQNAGEELIGYARYRLMSAEYGQQIQAPMADFVKIQEQWLEKLQAFVKDYPELPESADAMLQIAIASEFAGQESEANQWYTRITKEFDSELPAVAKATGAKRRLECVGKPLELQGQRSDGQNWKLSSLRGKPVVVYYWASWCEPCKDDFPQIKKLQEKYRNKVIFVGINLDTDENDFKSAATNQRLAWVHVREREGLDGPLANELGVLTVPTMLLLDKNGKVVNRNVHSKELDDELAKLVR